MPKVSIIVPVYKVEPYLKRCVDSLTNQTLKDIEIILVDDGSPDNCPKMCDDFAQLDSRIKVVHKQNGGAASARNIGLDLATGDYIAFVDSDDYIDKTMYESMLKISCDNNCDFVMCDCIKEYPDKKEIYTHNIRTGFYDKKQLINEYYPHLLIMENIEYPATISNCLFLFRRKLIDDNSIRYDSGIKYSEDLLFGAKLLYKAESFYYMKGEAFYHYCMNPTSVTHVFDSKKWDNYLRLHKLIKEYFEKNLVYDFSVQIELVLLFFLYNTITDLKNNSHYKKDQLIETLKRILNCKQVAYMFKKVNIFKLKIPFKQKLLTLLMKYKLISILIKI